MTEQQAGDKKQCAVEGCTNNVFARGWCSLHYTRIRRTGEPGPAAASRPRRSAMRECLVEGCGRGTVAHGFCDMHYRRWMATGEAGAPTPTRADNSGPCSVEGCDRRASKRGMCGMHYLRDREHGHVGSTESTRMPPTPDGLCRVEGCSKPTQAKQLCAMHLARLHAKGDVGPATPIRRRAPLRRKRGDGYVVIRVEGHPAADKSGFVLEHRIVMEAAMGRPLSDRENVHHINGVRDDNRIENLELWVKPQPSGQRVAELVEWVVSQYPEYVRAAMQSRAQLSLDMSV